MTLTRFFDWFQLAALGFVGALGLARAFVLYRRGVHVLAVDRQRSLAQGLADLGLLACLLSWAYASVACAWPLQTHRVPAWLCTELHVGLAGKLVGVVLDLAGVLLYASALWAFRDSWRIGIDRSTHGPLVTGGIFAWTRNPIYLAFDLLVVGTFLVLGRLVFLVLAVILVAMLHNQIRREERFLATAYGDAYLHYCAQVGRYFRGRWR